MNDGEKLMRILHILDRWEYTFRQMRCYYGKYINRCFDEIRKEIENGLPETD